MAAHFWSGLSSLSVALLLAGCATDSLPPANPDLGRSTAQIIARYGKPGNIRSTADGEVWIYNLDKDQKIIPWTKGYKARLRIVGFDRNGFVRTSKTDQ
jgi:hypothetical protein